MTMVLQWRGERIDETGVIRRAAGAAPAVGGWDRELDPDRVTSAWHRIGFSDVRRTPPLAWLEIQREIAARRPVAVGLGPKRPSGAAPCHMVLVIGWWIDHQGRRRVLGNDPFTRMDGEFDLPVDELREAGLADHGIWLASWIGIEPA